MRVLGLDFGDKTVGVALSDPFGWSAQGIETIRRQDESDLKSTISRLSKIIAEYNAELIVLGYPKNMDNSEGLRCKKTVLFKKKLNENFPELEVVLFDERLSTVAAGRTLLEADLSRSKRKKIIDKIAAVFILQNYLDSKSRN